MIKTTEIRTYLRWNDSQSESSLASVALYSLLISITASYLSHLPLYYVYPYSLHIYCFYLNRPMWRFFFGGAHAIKAT
ncbi:hypothetical protein HMPREF9694_05612 [Klebsiella michiganensis]|nr:hypothetical protein HMPREF9694_05612 [Klebsiella michiganensis]